MNEYELSLFYLVKCWDYLVLEGIFYTKQCSRFEK